MFFSPPGGESRNFVQAYSFTSAPIAKALVEAHKRGVRVQIILDRSQRKERYSSADFTAHAGIPTYIEITRSRIFVNSMSDLFHEKIPFYFIQKVFDVMNRSEQHIFQVLTKRSERLIELAPKLDWGFNIMMGVTVESPEYKYRIKRLTSTPAETKFLSIEPLLSPIPDLPLKGIDWVIVTDP